MAPSNYFHKPELALRRAIELQHIYQNDAALELLHDVLSSRRHRTWSLIYEQIMIVYIDLCCISNKSREVKDGLHQYRNLCQVHAPGSLEKVILYLLNKAEMACQEAKSYVDDHNVAAASSSSDAVVVAVATAVVPTTEDGAATTGTPSSNPEDDGNEDRNGEDDAGMDGFIASPQAILLSTISTDPIKLQQRDTSILVPSLKFLWEIYRAILDILRSNSKLEHVYHTAAQGALKFCQTYHRKMEFRHLCDMLRMHLGNLRQFGIITPSSGNNENDADGNATNKSNNKVRW
jgi:translation initiation factor 3 subunit A